MNDKLSRALAETAGSGSSGPDGPEHKRFRKLMAQIDAARERLAAWQRALPEFAAAYDERVGPIRRRMKEARRAWAFELEQLYLAGRWSKADERTLRRLIEELALAGLQDTPDDAELLALHDRHAEVDLATAEQQELVEMKAAFEAIGGMDLGDEPVASVDELYERAHARMAEQREQQAAARPRKGRAARPSTAQQRAEKEAKEATQTVREVYRKLAAALHPDRAEPGATPEQLGARHEQMARANAAYEAGDLLALLALQLEIEQVDVARAASIAASQVKHFNRVLAEQAREIEMELARLERGFVDGYGILVGQRPNPAKIGQYLKQEVNEALAAERALEHDRRLFAHGDAASIKRFLKQLGAQYGVEDRMDALGFF